MTFHIGKPEENAIVDARVGKGSNVVCGRGALCPGLIGRWRFGEYPERTPLDPHPRPFEGRYYLVHPDGYRIEKDTGWYAVVEADRDEMGRWKRKGGGTRRPALKGSTGVYLPLEGDMRPADRDELIRRLENKALASDGITWVFGHYPVLPAIVRCSVCGHPNRVEESLLLRR